MVKEEAIKREHHIGREGGGDLDLLVLLSNPSDELGFLSQRVAVDLRMGVGQSEVSGAPNETVSSLDLLCDDEKGQRQLKGDTKRQLTLRSKRG